MQKQILTEIELMLTSTLLPETCHVLGKKIVDGLILILCLVQYLLKRDLRWARGGNANKMTIFCKFVGLPFKFFLLSFAIVCVKIS